MLTQAKQDERFNSVLIPQSSVLLRRRMDRRPSSRDPGQDSGAVLLVGSHHVPHLAAIERFDRSRRFFRPFSRSVLSPQSSAPDLRGFSREGRRCADQGCFASAYRIIRHPVAAPDPCAVEGGLG